MHEHEANPMMKEVQGSERLLKWYCDGNFYARQQAIPLKAGASSLSHA
tara:strand:- start:849 stop:992 length:144 start_codon:yes stop_codon:yes gene_type:complete